MDLKLMPLKIVMHKLVIIGHVNLFLKLSEKYGKVFSVKLGPTTTVVLTGYEAVKDALVNNADEFGERAHIPIFEATLKGHGIIFGHGESWKQMRRFTLITLRDFGMGKKSIEDKIIEESDLLVKMIDSHKGQPFNPTLQMNCVVANIMCSIIFGGRFDYEDEKFVSLVKRINENIQLFGSPAVHVSLIFHLNSDTFQKRSFATCNNWKGSVSGVSVNLWCSIIGH
ncbi:cytochrome P450 2H2-like [Rhincodon typus]|uniref:cytochrome P450 2H2-like n=1 Tax=Rhincodon typus TaxID=259920 RepID=UPI00202E81D8|nr:cytochrome P450 2H2-like [Rhincodon typus]